VATSADVATFLVFRSATRLAQRQLDERLASGAVPCDVVVLLAWPFVVGPLRGAGQQVPHLQQHVSPQVRGAPSHT
jgi:hypothetical protein